MSHFPSQNAWDENYKTIIELGKRLPSFDTKNKQEKWLIKACQSPLWLKAEINPAGELVFTGDSEGLISKGLLALIIEFYSHRRPKEILEDQPQFIQDLDLAQYLSVRRTNGLQSILNQILQYAKAFLILSKSNPSL
ncbi:MAG: SufE family protein [Oligoflexia bacterium]|nr:SufE family protein [Oligoflexia bacterium]